MTGASDSYNFTYYNNGKDFLQLNDHVRFHSDSSDSIPIHSIEFLFNHIRMALNVEQWQYLNMFPISYHIIKRNPSRKKLSSSNWE